MAKVRLPILSGQATGSIGQAISFYRCRNIQTARKYAIPSRPDTEPQVDASALFAQAVAAYQQASLTQDDKQAWRYWHGGSLGNRTAYTAWLQEWMDATRRGNTWSYYWEGEVLYQGIYFLRLGIRCRPGTPAPVLHWRTDFGPNYYAVPMTEYFPWRWQAEALNLRPSSVYWWYVDGGTKWVDYGHTGLYRSRTKPVPP